MTDYKAYIQECLDNNDNDELILSWSFLGEQKADANTRMYKSGNVYLINEATSKFNNCLFYCEADHIGKIDWAKVKNLDEVNQTTIVNGITSSCFTFFPTPVDLTNLEMLLNEAETTGYTPFSKYDADVSKNIIIDQDTYMQIMQVVGMPFVKQREIEYNKRAILKLAVEPALRMYYTYFPLIQEQVIPSRAGGDFRIKYPEKPYPAYKAIAWVTSPGVARGALNGLSPLSALGTEVSLFTRSTSGSRFSQGLHYNKPVPGFTGEANGNSAYSNMATVIPLSNTLKNMMRREKLSKIHVPGEGLYAVGYSTLTGYLNIKWLCWSRDFNDVEFEDWPQVIQLCQSHVKKSIGSIRALLRADSNLPFDAESMRKEGIAEIEAKDKEWAASPMNKIHAIERGGMAF